MSSSILDKDLYSLSFDSVEEDSNNPWFSLIQNLTYENLEKLKEVFQEKSEDGEEIGLTKEEFLDTICFLYGNSKYSLQSNLLYEDITKSSQKSTIKWNDFLDFLIENLNPEVDLPVALNLRKIDDVPHVKRETVVKIVLIETKSFFCYAIVSKHGRIGLYDGNLNFLTSYHVIMTREDITRTEDERRRRNRWVTDAIFCQDIQMFIVTNSARTLMIYEASGLKHMPYWLIIGLPEVAQCLAYKGFTTLKPEETDQYIILFIGCFNGNLMHFKFVQPNIGLLKRKQPDNISVYYWDELEHERAYLEIKTHKNVHNNTINKIVYYPEEDCIITCSNDPKCSVIKKFYSHMKQSCTYKMHRGCICFSSSAKRKLLVTGGPDGIIRVWNPLVISKPIANLVGHFCTIVDVVIMENQDVLVSLADDGVFKSWDLKEMKCFQTIKIKFPSFSVHGKTIEFGMDSIHPGPRRMIETKTNSGYMKKCFSLDEVVEKGEDETKEIEGSDLNRWERSCILVTCCNHIAEIVLKFKAMNIEETFENPVLPPPPLQNSVLIPSSWRIGDKENDLSRHESISKTNELLKSVDFILNKNLVEKDGAKSNVNYKIALLETKKLQMQSHIAKGAPYLALDLFDVDELRLSENLPVPNKKSIRNVVAKTENLLLDAAKRDQIFSEPSTSSRTKSSRSSIVEFPL